jgi:hypothetical protein
LASQVPDRASIDLAYWRSMRSHANVQFSLVLARSGEVGKDASMTDLSSASSDESRFGRLVKVAARTGWAHEALQFTPWLAENLDLLGQAVGLALDLREREHPVGKYSLDLLLEDAQERVVIVENQFGSTDHDHLGKLLTYCAGTGADVVIWIAEHLNEEHIAALEWLNENTIQGVGFFGVELELLQIGDSLPAPHFRVVARPNEWIKSVRPPVVSPTEWTWANYADQLRIPDERIAIGRALVDRVQQAIDTAGLPWQPRFRKGYVTFQRPGGYNVVLIYLWWFEVPRLAIKLPDAPESLGLTSPYPELADAWIPRDNDWRWSVPSVQAVPDVTAAIELVKPFHPANGPMVGPDAPSPGDPGSASVP